MVEGVQYDIDYKFEQSVNIGSMQYNNGGGQYDTVARGGQSLQYDIDS